jgi:uncharacterized repeat protein (TIGR03803 family)
MGFRENITMKTAHRLAVVLLLMVGGVGRASGQMLTNLYQFSGGTDGLGPQAGLVQGCDGYFYGTTYFGGLLTMNSPLGYGTVFKITPQGKLTPLWQFNGFNGLNPEAGLVQGSDGNFYGTTYVGGANYYDPGVNNGYGTVFKITPQGTLTTLYNFCDQPGCADGLGPQAGLVQGSDGNFYGTTAYGGTQTNCAAGCGTVFRITSQGTLTTLYNFCDQPGCADGLGPQASLVQGSDGNFYGTAYWGGTNGYGTVFKITSQGMLTTLCQFNGANGWNPRAGLVQGSDGNFYGTTEGGGTNSIGTVFKITSQGTLTTLWQFNGSDGTSPFGSLVQGSDGSFYGTTWFGGTNGLGTVFKITPQGALTTLYQFGGFPTDSEWPWGGWCRAVTAVSTGRARKAGEAATVPCFN